MEPARDTRQVHPEVEFGIAAWGYVRLTPEQLQRLRKQPAERFPESVTPISLKHSDEQTIASMTAVCLAMEQFGLSAAEQSSWGIVAAPRFLGRTAMAASMHRFETDGPWGASVQIVPQRSQHSVASALSLMLQAHGPCVGAGGGLRGDVEAILAVAGLLERSELPGFWLVASGWDPELGIDRTGQATTDSSCIAMAMALVPDTLSGQGGRLRFWPTSANPSRDLENEVGLLNSLSCLLDFISPQRMKTMNLFGESLQGLKWEVKLYPPRTATEMEISAERIGIRETSVVFS